MNRVGGGAISQEESGGKGRMGWVFTLANGNDFSLKAT